MVVSSRDLSPRLSGRGKLALLLLLLCGLTVLGYLRLAPGQRAPAGSSPRPEPGGNVLLVVCDTLRADHLGFHGYPRPTSPFLDELAARAWVYDSAYSHFPYTWPTISNLFTGLPYSQLVQEGLFTAPVEGLQGGGLSPRSQTLAQRLLAAGVTPMAVSANPYLTSEMGFGQGFVRFHDIYSWNPDFWSVAIHQYTAEEVNGVAAAYLDDLAAAGKPWFLYLHYFDPHMPYTAPPAERALFEDPTYQRTGRVVDGYLKDPKGGYLSWLNDELRSWLDAADVAHLVAQYDAEIRYLDRGLRELFRLLDAKGLLDETTVIITADHGEAFMERDFWGHGYLSRDEEEHVPLIVVHPRRRSRPAARIPDVVTTTDIHFSILDHFGVSEPSAGKQPWWGFDVLTRRRRSAVAYTEGVWDTAILRTKRYSYYRYTRMSESPNPGPDGEFLFDRARDPGEERDLFGDDPRLAAAVRAQLAKTFAARSALLPVGAWGEPFQDADAESRRRLQALGYVN